MDSRMELEQLVRRYADMVYRIALVNMKNKSDAEDVFQETFLRFSQHQKKLKTEEHQKAWLIRVTINCCKKQFGSAWRKRVVSLADEAVPEVAVCDKHEDDTVYRAVQSLPPTYRQPVHLFYFEDLPIKQIAKILGARETTVKSQLSRGRALIKEMLQEVDFDEG